MADEDDKIRKKAQETAAIIQDAFASIAAAIPAMFEEALSSAEDGVATFAKTVQKDVTKAVNSMAKASKQLVDNQLKLAQGQMKSKDITDQILAAKAKQIGVERALTVALRNNSISQEDYNKMVQQTRDQTKLITEELKKQEKIAKTGAGFETIAKVLEKVPIIGSTLAKSFNDAKTAAVAAAAAGEKFPLMKGAVAGAKTLVGQFTSIPAIITTIITMMTKLDKNATDLSKSMNMSYEEGHKLDAKLLSAGNNAKDLAANYDNLVAAQQSLNEQSGIYHERSVETLKTHAQLTQRFGLTNEEAYRFEKFSNASGKNYNKLVKETKLLGVNMGKANGLNFNALKLMKQVATVSATVSSNLGNNPAKIMEAVVAAKLLGTDLKTIEGTLAKLTDFESSIANEMEAELLIGREINLERARLLALNGDMTGVAEELQEQVGSEAEWLELNLIQRQALADSMGMSVEQMGEMFLTQEEQKALQEEQAQLKEDELERNSLQLTLMQELQLVITRIKNEFLEMWQGPIRHIAIAFKNFITDEKKMEKLLNGIKKVMTAIEWIFKIIVTRHMAKMITGFIRSIALTGVLGGKMRKNALTMGVGAAGAAAESQGRNPIPIVGAIAAIAAFTGMMAMVNSALPSFDTGGLVGKTGVAVVHQGEVVTPAEKVPGTEGGFNSMTKSDMQEAMMAAVSNIQPPSYQLVSDNQILAETTANLSANRGGYGDAIA